MSLRARHVVDLTSAVGAVADSRWIRVGNAKVTVQVVTAPNAVVQIEGNSGPGLVAATLTHEPAGGVANMTALGAGIYTVRERPEWIRVHLAIDAGGPRAFRVILTFDVEVDE